MIRSTLAEKPMHSCFNLRLPGFRPIPFFQVLQRSPNKTERKTTNELIIYLGDYLLLIEKKESMQNKPFVLELQDLRGRLGFLVHPYKQQMTF